MKRMLFCLCLFYSGAVCAQGYAPTARPYRPGMGGVGGAIYGDNSARAIRPLASPPPDARAYHRPAAAGTPKDTAMTEDTLFFRKYIKEHPEVLPDVKIEGKVEW